MSHISRWLEPPFKKMTMHESALVADVAPARLLDALNILGRVRPAMPAAPTVNSCLRFRLFLNIGMNRTMSTSVV